MTMLKNPFSMEPKVDQHNRTVIGLPFPPGAMRDVVVVVRKQDGTIDVAGPILDPSRCTQLLREGIARVIQYAERENKALIQPAQFIPPGLRDIKE